MVDISMVTRQTSTLTELSADWKPAPGVTSDNSTVNSHLVLHIQHSFPQSLSSFHYTTFVPATVVVQVEHLVQ